MIQPPSPHTGAAVTLLREEKRRVQDIRRAGGGDHSLAAGERRELLIQTALELRQLSKAILILQEWKP